MIARKNYSRGHTPINAGSMADIAFLLLVFFLVTTTLEVGLGITRLMAPLSDAPPSPVVARNILHVQVNDAGALLVNDRPQSRSELRATATEFLTNPNDRSDLPTMTTITEALCTERLGTLGSGPQHSLWEQRLEAVRQIGPYREPPADAHILITAGSSTSYADYIAIQDELEGAVRELRDALSLRAFGRSFSALEEHDAVDRARIHAIRCAVPLRIGDAELVNVPDRP